MVVYPQAARNITTPAISHNEAIVVATVFSPQATVLSVFVGANKVYAIINATPLIILSRAVQNK